MNRRDYRPAHFSQIVVVLNRLYADIGAKLVRSAEVRMWGFAFEEDPAPLSFANVCVQLDAKAEWETPDYARINEETVIGLLDKLPDPTLHRINGSMWITGVTGTNVSWSVHCGRGVCRRVRTGSRTLTVPDPALVKDIPLVEVTEPVYEYICDDPLLELS